MALDESYSPERMLALSEDDRAKKLSKLTLDEKVAVLRATAVDQIIKGWCDESLRITKRAGDDGDMVTVNNVPDLIKLYAGSIAYITMLERGTEEMMRDELMLQDSGSQLLTAQADQFMTTISRLKQELAKASDSLEDWLSLRLIRREMRMNVDADGTVSDVSSFEDSNIEQPRLINKEKTND